METRCKSAFNTEVTKDIAMSDQPPPAQDESPPPAQDEGPPPAQDESPPPPPAPTPATLAALVQSETVSKRSVERLYSAHDEPQFLRHFVKKPQRRSAVINRGFWVRMCAVEYVVSSFLQEAPRHGTPKRRVVVNLGCG